jgi:RHS repeat-associated protein
MKPTSSKFNRRGNVFPGQYFDQETGLHQNYFRDYDPKMGRYIEPDPIGERHLKR